MAAIYIDYVEQMTQDIASGKGQCQAGAKGKAMCRNIVNS